MRLCGLGYDAGLEMVSAKVNVMKYLLFITRILLVIGGLNWLMVGLFEFDIVAAIFHDNLRLAARLV